jgi:lysophospholipid acyltransferase (LPLAT)-like uncharacterized protein
MKGWLKSPRIQTALAALTGRYLRFAIRTIDWRIEDHGAIAGLVRGENGIIAFWHETLPAMPVLLLRARRQGLTQAGHVLVSRHRDGQFIGQAMRAFGMPMISGSTSRGGASALRAMLRVLAGGDSIVLTPDGPRGPRRVAASGVAQLAARSGAPVFPCAAITRPAISLPSWDRMRIPMPFTRGALVCRPPVLVPRHAAAAMLPVIEAELQAALSQAEHCQEEHWQAARA